MNSDLKSDTKFDTLIHAEYYRQASGIELIASENFAPVGVLQCLGSLLTNKCVVRHLKLHTLISNSY